MPKRMNAALQERKLREDLARMGLAVDMIDVHAHLDRTLSYTENRRNLAKLFGYRLRAISADDLEQYDRASRANYARTRKKTPTTQRKVSKKAFSQMKLLPAWQSDPYRRPGKADEKRTAKTPGRRRAVKTGKIYYERRTNRSDMPGKRV